MHVEKMRELYRAQPFRPFGIRLPGERMIAVQHPEYLAISPNGRTAVAYQPDGSLNIVDVMLVTDLEVKPGAATQANDE